jgi:hypothetical protein
MYILCLPEHGLGAFAYTWVNGDGLAGRLVTVYGDEGPAPLVFDLIDNEVVSRKMDFDDWKVAGLTVRQGAPLRDAYVHYRGRNLSLELNYSANHPAFSYNSHPAGCPGWLAANRYEQSGSAHGTLELHGRRISIASTAHRDHSWGRRAWGEPTKYMWFIAQSGAALSLNVMVIDIDASRTVLGYVARDGVALAAVQADVVEDLDEHLRPRGVRATFTDEAGARMAFVGRKAAMMEFEWAGGRCIYVETTLGCELDGRPGVGHLEYMWSKALHDQLLAP